MSSLADLAINDKGYAFDPTTGASYTLNDCGAFIIKALQHGDSDEQIVAILATEHGESAARLRQDLDDFHARLAQLGLGA